MKTPLQQLIQQLNQRITEEPNNQAYKLVLEDVERLIEAEKEFIRDVYWEGGQDVPCHSSTVDMWFDGVFNYND